MVRTRVQQIWKLRIQLQPSGRLPIMVWKLANRYGNCVLKINRLDGHPPWSGRAKPYMEITYSGRATVLTIMPHRLDAALKQERFSVKISKFSVAQLSVRTAHVHRPDGVRTYHSSHPFELSAYK